LRERLQKAFNSREEKKKNIKEVLKLNAFQGGWKGGKIDLREETRHRGRVVAELIKPSSPSGKKT